MVNIKISRFSRAKKNEPIKIDEPIKQNEINEPIIQNEINEPVMQNEIN